MPLVISILNQKGGAGKTTIATNLACAIHAQGDKVLLVDSDPQGSARDWKEAGNSPVPVIGLDRPQALKNDLESVSRDFDVVVIDGAPRVEEMSVAALKISDLVLIPIQPSPYDIWASSDLVDLIKQRQEIADGEPKAAFIVSRAITNTKLSGEVKEALAEFGLPVFEHGTVQRVAYPSSASEGRSVIGVDPMAEAEIKAIVKEIEGVFA